MKGEFNLLEQLVREAMEERNGVAQRMYVKRRSLGPEAFRWMEKGKEPELEKFRSFLDGLPPEEDLSIWFRPSDRWQQPPDSESFELDYDRYCKRPVESRERANFAFSLPVPITSKTWILYAQVYRGFLWAYGFFCHFSGDLRHPESLRTQMLWGS